MYYFSDEDTLKIDLSVALLLACSTCAFLPGYPNHPRDQAKAIDVEHAKLMDYPSNGVVVWGFLKPTFIDEEFYLRRLFHDEDNDGDSSDSEASSWSITKLFSAFGSSRYTSFILPEVALRLVSQMEMSRALVQAMMEAVSVVSVQDFQYAEPDVLVHSIPSILERFGESRTRCNSALKALCKKKGLYAEGANLIGVDSLGMDVRVSSGTEVRTHRFSFKVRPQLVSLPPCVLPTVLDPTDASLDDKEILSLPQYYGPCMSSQSPTHVQHSLGTSSMYTFVVVVFYALFDPRGNLALARNLSAAFVPKGGHLGPTLFVREL
ncbi:hypothetical protein Sango_0778500 [Sesamum angolense]|uniref:Uncharacterized protein n=1 Tax=Sesamum angolense TaxID=2727404 RepID=A0AAE1X3M1_9LAMI|nr:hypothetical protein Sango_0778500 [Sesamum angolense]